MIETKKLNPKEERAARLQLLQVLERQPGALSQAEADRIATEAKHRTRKRRRT